MSRKENLVDLACLVILLGCVATTCGCGRNDTTTTHKLEIDAGSVYEVIRAVQIAEEENKADTAQSAEAEAVTVIDCNKLDSTNPKHSWNEAASGDIRCKQCGIYYGMEEEVVGPPGWQESVEKLVEAQVSAYLRKDLEDLMDVVHPESPEYDKTVSMMETLFDLDLDLDIKYEITEASYNVDENAVHVSTEQVTRKLGGASRFMDNVSRCITVFRKHEGQWKAWSTKITSVEWLQIPTMTIEEVEPTAI